MCKFTLTPFIAVCCLRALPKISIKTPSISMWRVGCTKFWGFQLFLCIIHQNLLIIKWSAVHSSPLLLADCCHSIQNNRHKDTSTKTKVSCYKFLNSGITWMILASNTSFSSSEYLAEKTLGCLLPAVSIGNTNLLLFAGSCMIWPYSWPHSWPLPYSFFLYSLLQKQKQKTSA